jgi:uncharacterized protein YjbI with pentapeptide repeats
MFKQIVIIASAFCATLAHAQPVTSPAARAATIQSVESGRKACSACDLFQADFSWHSLIGRDFSGARLRQADLQAGTFDRTRFSGADLTIINAFGARFAAADFTRANLFRANLVGASFDNAQLSGANLREAIVAGADLSKARGLTQSQLSTACGNGATLLPVGLTVPAC